MAAPADPGRAEGLDRTDVPGRPGGVAAARAGPGRLAPARARQARPGLRHRLRVQLRRDWPLVAMTLPAIAFLAVFHYLPTLGNVVAFQDYNPFVGDTPVAAFIESRWIGFGNFEVLFRDARFWQALLNTLKFSAAQLIMFFPVPIALAILLQSVLHPRVRLFIQGVVYLPHFFSWVIVVTFFLQMFGGAGLLAQHLRTSGFDPPEIMTNPDTFLFLVMSEIVWKDVGWGTIIFLAALSAINPNLYEAAAADGAGRWRRLWHITLPGIRPVIVLLLILRLGDSLTVGFEQFILQRDAVGPAAAEVLDTYVYFHGLLTQQYGVGAAAGLFKGAVGLTLVLIANKVAHKLGEQGIYSKS
jgi:putative aldouronate transport system permease protein